MKQDVGGSWAAVATMRECDDLMLAWAAHHLGIGAVFVAIFLDDPAPATVARLSAVPGVRVFPCDDAHWKRTGFERSDQQEWRQIRNADWLRERVRGEVDWLVHVDADEFLATRAPLSEELAALPRRVAALRFPVRERVWIGAPDPGILEGAFRVELAEDDFVPPTLFGPASDFLRQGLGGHILGKCATRVDSPFRMGVHRPRPTHDRKPPTMTSRSTRLLHFDGLTPAHWMRKIARYAQDPRYYEGARKRHHRAQQVLAARAGPDALREVHDAIRIVPEAQAGRLFALGLLERFAIDPARALARLAPAEAIDLTAAGFDARLGDAAIRTAC
ncbi:MAG: glycosyltransferase family 2 protein [Hasllibacter sp.]